MSSLSRRTFLQLAGVTVLGSLLDTAPLFQRPQLHTPPMGRTLDTVPVYDSPTLSAATRSRLWPDSIVPINSARSGWYRVPGGYAESISLQPMALTAPDGAWEPGQVEWAEVSAPVAAVRRWAAADAPLVTRIGHGGVARIVDFLSEGSDRWIAVGTHTGELLGWSQQVHWHAVRPASTQRQITHLTIHHQTLTAFSGQRALVRALVSTGERPAPGVYRLRPAQAGGEHWKLDEWGEIHAVPWSLEFGPAHRLSGVYWHNRFGQAADGPALQTTPMLARWLYENLDHNGSVTIL